MTHTSVSDSYSQRYAAKGEPKDDQQSKARKVCAWHLNVRIIYMSDGNVFFVATETNNKPHDASTPSGSTPGEAVRNMLKKNPKYSKRINYDALKDLFDGDSLSLVPTNIDLDEKEDDMYHLSENEKSDGEGRVGDRGGGGAGALGWHRRRLLLRAARSGRQRLRSLTLLSLWRGMGLGSTQTQMPMPTGKVDASYAYEEGETFDEEKGGEYAWEDAYEQEV